MPTLVREGVDVAGENLVDAQAVVDEQAHELHALRRAVFYANEGHVRQRTPEQQSEQALCLAIVVNAVIAWNTVYTGLVLRGRGGASAWRVERQDHPVACDAVVCGWVLIADFVGVRVPALWREARCPVP